MINHDDIFSAIDAKRQHMSDLRESYSAACEVYGSEDEAKYVIELALERDDRDIELLNKAAGALFCRDNPTKKLRGHDPEYMSADELKRIEEITGKTFDYDQIALVIDLTGITPENHYDKLKAFMCDLRPALYDDHFERQNAVLVLALNIYYKRGVKLI